jgi:hypothetical protein
MSVCCPGLSSCSLKPILVGLAKLVILGGNYSGFSYVGKITIEQNAYWSIFGAQIRLTSAPNPRCEPVKEIIVDESIVHANSWPTVVQYGLFE